MSDPDSYRKQIQDALDADKKPVLCVVDNYGNKSIALITSICRGSGLFIDSFYGSWFNAVPVAPDFDFVVIGSGDKSVGFSQMLQDVQ